MIAELLISEASVRRGGRVLFDGLSFALRPGEACALVGPNGSGKTSLLRAIAGLVRLEAGEIRFGDADPAEARASALHFVGHQDGLKPARTVREELEFWGRWVGGTEAAVAQAAEAYDLVRLLDLEVRRLSAGQRRRLALSRTAAAERPLWLLDEPLSPLDAQWRERMGRAMARHLDAGGMILAAVHDPLPIPAKTLDLGA
jgi:heme exporter protein A